MRFLMLLVVVGLSACQGSVGFGKQSRTDVFQQSATDEVDILWVVDSSNSMALEQELLGRGFASFAEELERSNTDFHVGVITTSFDYDDDSRGQLIGDPAVIDRSDADYVNTFKSRALVGINGSGKEKGLEAAAYALSPSLTTGPNAGFLRDDANLLIVVISDEDDCSDNGALELQSSEACYTERELLTPTSAFVNTFAGLKSGEQKVTLSAIVGPEEAVGVCDETTLPGRRYIEVAGQLDGLTSSICEADWSGILADLGLTASGILTSFELQNQPEPETIEVRVDGLLVAQSEFDGWTFDEETNQIIFHGQAIPARGSEIVVKYTIASGAR